MPVVWREQLAVGDPQIDQDHRYLLCLFNCIELSLSSAETLGHLPLFFGQLLEYTCEHFQREEALQARVGYPALAEHRSAHARIVEMLVELDGGLQREFALLGGVENVAVIDGTRRAALDALRARLGPELLQLAREWVIEHVIRMDKPMEPWLRRAAC
ncbi:MAG: Bacteriohemerythrin [Pseudomonadales bacterium]|nr:Bacteriohemerythrin [Pseudomonadales bacterium]